MDLSALMQALGAQAPQPQPQEPGPSWLDDIMSQIGNPTDFIADRLYQTGQLKPADILKEAIRLNPISGNIVGSMEGLKELYARGKMRAEANKPAPQVPSTVKEAAAILSSPEEQEPAPLDLQEVLVRAADMGITPEFKVSKNQKVKNSAGTFSSMGMTTPADRNLASDLSLAQIRAMMERRSQKEKSQTEVLKAIITALGRSQDLSGKVSPSEILATLLQRISAGGEQKASGSNLKSGAKKAGK